MKHERSLDRQFSNFSEFVRQAKGNLVLHLSIRQALVGETPIQYGPKATVTVGRISTMPHCEVSKRDDQPNIIYASQISEASAFLPAAGCISGVDYAVTQQPSLLATALPLELPGASMLPTYDEILINWPHITENVPTDISVAGDAIPVFVGDLNSKAESTNHFANLATIASLALENIDK